MSGKSIGDDRLVAEIKRTLQGIEQRDPNWRMMYANGNFTAEQVIYKMDTDKKFRGIVLEQFIGLAVELAARGRTENVDFSAPSI
ncbi:unnamed protein product [marine sediment metagenome]|uniref:Uncharacterized protein n=1 Tax=marine sediment metagenome TaxID=412755 RepID=X0UVJ7_9ZZZZ